MPSRSRPTCIGEFTPHVERRLAFSFRKIFKSIARECHRRKTICLRTQQSTVLPRPGMHRLKKMLLGEFCQNFSPIVADGFGFWTIVSDQRRKVRRKIVTA